MPSPPKDLDRVFEDWPYQPGVISARIVRCRDGRHVLQMRIEMGVLQMELKGRPDGERPEGAETYLDHLLGQSLSWGEEYVLNEEQCLEVDREFIQFYHRRICLLALREFGRAVRDADHTLALMDFAAAHSPDEDWTLSHEQYRPFVIFHRTQAAALAELKENRAEAAIEECNRGLERIRGVFETLQAEEQFDDDELVGQLVRFKESLREEYDVGRTLDEQLTDAIAKEEYEKAAQLRDEIARRTGRA